MLLRTEIIRRKDGVQLIRTYSDENKLIRQIETGVLYEEAVDMCDNEFTYEETDILIAEYSAESEELNYD